MNCDNLATNFIKVIGITTSYPHDYDDLDAIFEFTRREYAKLVRNDVEQSDKLGDQHYCDECFSNYDEIGAPNIPIQEVIFPI